MPDAFPETDSPDRPATVARRAPLLWVGAALVAGYVLAQSQPYRSPVILAGLALLFAAGALVVAVFAPPTGFRNWKISSAWGAAFLVAGTLLAWAWHEVRAPAPPGAWENLPPREARLTLRVTRSFSQRTGSDYAGGLAMVVAAPPIFQELQGRSVLYRVRARTGEYVPVRGATMEATGLLGYLPDLAPDFGNLASDEEKLYAANAARFRSYVHSQGAWFELARGRVEREVAPPNARESRLATMHEKLKAVLRNGPAGWEEKFGNMYAALLLGESAQLDSDERDVFTEAGVIYFFALSGLHVAVLAAALWWLLRKIPRVPHAVSDLVIIAIVWLYVEIAGGSPSARRAAMMLTFYLLARWLGRASSPLAAWVAAGVGTLLVEPRALGNPAFELSFGVVLGLILYAPLFRWTMGKKWAPWRDIPAESLAPWRKCVLRLWECVMDLLATSWTAVLCSAGLTADFFGVFSINSLFFSIVMFPPACVALWAGAIAVAAGAWGVPPLSWLAWLANAVGLMAVGLMHAFANVVHWLPGLGPLQVTPAHAGSVATLLVLASMLFAQPKNGPATWKYFALPVAILAGFAVLCVREM